MKALILGIAGQDGACLAHHLLASGIEVHGTSRDSHGKVPANLTRLGINKQVVLHHVDPVNDAMLARCIGELAPDYVYNLAGPSSVARSFDRPRHTVEAITAGTLNLLETVRRMQRPPKLYLAGSSECFGDTGARPADETTAFQPLSPYAAAKAGALWCARTYREAYGLFICNGIAFNHESVLRPATFVTRKISMAAARIAAGSNERLRLGDLDIVRDWGWAPEYVEAMAMLMEHDTPGDYVIATGESHSLRDFVAEAFSALGLDWRDHVDSDRALYRPSELRMSLANPAKLQSTFGWTPRYRMRDVARMMAETDRAALED